MVAASNRPTGEGNLPARDSSLPAGDEHRLLRRWSARGGLRALPFVVAASAWRYVRRQSTAARLRYIGVAMGQRCHIGPAIRCAHPGNVRFGNRVVLGERVRLWSETPDGRLLLGDGCEVGRGTVLDFSGGLTLGDGALISEEVLVYTHDHGHDPHSVPVCRPLELGERCWIGARAIILPRVRRIGRGAVIGAGAVVTCDVPDGGVFVGASGRLLPSGIELPSPALGEPVGPRESL